MNSIGFTGTRAGLTAGQVRTLQRELRFMMDYRNAEIFRHGDCKGSDEAAHNIAIEAGYKVVLHPPTDITIRAFCNRPWRVMLCEPYQERKKTIVIRSSLLIACPRQEKEIVRSETWWTIRFARELDKNIMIILPSGDLHFER